MIAMLRPRRLAKDTQFSLLPDLVPAKELRPKRRNSRVSPGQGSLFDASVFELPALQPKAKAEEKSASTAKGRRARKGGEYVAGHFYKGGQWIPKAAFEAQQNNQSYSPDSSKAKPKSEAKLQVLSLDTSEPESGTVVPAQVQDQEVRSQPEPELISPTDKLKARLEGIGKIKGVSQQMMDAAIARLDNEQGAGEWAQRIIDEAKSPEEVAKRLVDAHKFMTKLERQQSKHQRLKDALESKATAIAPKDDQVVGQAEKNVAELLDKLGLSEAAFSDNFHIRLKNDGYQDLVIEKHPDGRLYLTHYYEQNGDQVPDGEMVYRVHDNGQLKFIETAVTGPWGESRRPDKQFANVFARNLLAQGWHKADLLQAHSVTHPELTGESQVEAEPKKDSDQEVRSQAEPDGGTTVPDRLSVTQEEYRELGSRRKPKTHQIEKYQVDGDTYERRIKVVNGHKYQLKDIGNRRIHWALMDQPESQVSPEQVDALLAAVQDKVKPPIEWTSDTRMTAIVKNSVEQVLDQELPKSVGRDEFRAVLDEVMSRMESLVPHQGDPPRPADSNRKEQPAKTAQEVLDALPGAGMTDAEAAPSVAVDADYQAASGVQTRKRINKQVRELLKRKDGDYTEEEQVLLAQYSGKGGLKDDEASINEYYTRPDVAAFMADLLYKHGFKGGAVLEPSCGAGVFLSQFKDRGDVLPVGVELDGTSSAVAARLNPHAHVAEGQQFERFLLDNPDFQPEAVIGNVPFGTRIVTSDMQASKHLLNQWKDSAHYFLHQSMDRLQPGGVMAVVVPRGIVSGSSHMKLRQELVKQGRVLGSYRLPNDAFKHSGTATITDVLVIQKHPDAVLNAIAAGDKKAIEATADHAFVGGAYYDNHPQHVLGEIEEFMRGDRKDFTVKGDTASAIANAPEFEERVTYEGIGAVDTDKPKEGDQKYINGRRYELRGGRWHRIDDEPETDESQVDASAFGVGSMLEAEQNLSDPGLRVQIPAGQIEAYQLLDRQNGAVNRQALELAARVSAHGSNDAEKDKLAHAALLATHIDDLQDEPDQAALEQALGMLQAYREKYGNPASDRALSKLALEHPTLLKLQGAFDESGKISDYFSNHEAVVATVERRHSNEKQAMLEAFRANGGDAVSLTQVRQALSSNLSDDDLTAALLADEGVGFKDGRFMPVGSLMKGNGYELMDALMVERETYPEGSPEHRKLEAQISAVRSQLEPRPIEEMTTPFFAVGTWIPIAAMNEFLADRGLRLRVRFDEEDGKFYSTEGGAWGLAEDILTSMNRGRISHGTNTKEAKEAVAAAELEFKEWLAGSTYRTDVEEAYNLAFNSELHGEFDGSHLEISKFDQHDGDSEKGIRKKRLHDYQTSTIRQMTEQGRGIISLGVGLGKTATSIGLALHLKEQGRANKPTFVVPKSVLANWVREIGFWSPDANVMILGQTQQFWNDGSPAWEVPGHKFKMAKGNPKRDKAGNYILNRADDGEEVTMTQAEVEKKGNLYFRDDDRATKERKMQQLAQNSYDIVLMSEPVFQDIGLNPDKELAYMEDIVGQHLNPDSKATKEKSHKLQEQIETRKRKLLERQGDKTENITFEDLGIDCLIHDEAHHLKNLFGTQRTGDVAFLSTAESNRSLDFYYKSRYIREQNQNQNVYLLTATPTTNNPLEAFNMLQHVCPEEFEKRGITNVDDFLAMFGDIQNVMVPGVNLEMTEKNGLVGFKNLKDLRSLFTKYCRMQSAKDVGLEIPEEKVHDVFVDMSPEQMDIYADLKARAKELMKKEDKFSHEEGDDHIFSVISDMDKAALDLDYYNASHSDFATPAEVPEGGFKSPKIDSCVERVMGSRAKDKGKQIIFCDSIQMHDRLKQQLVDAGYPADEIQIVNAQTAKKSSDRQKISQAYNDGRISLVIGNTATMGEGMNFQIGTTDIHHLSTPWTPAAIEQRNGRGVRQGNELDNVGIHYYHANKSFDAYRKGVVERKRGWIDDLWHGSEDTAKNANAGGLGMDEIAVMMSDDPEAARRELAANKEAQTAQFQAREKQASLKKFGQLQTMKLAYSKMKPEDQNSDRGRALQARIDATVGALSRNAHFPHKSLLDGSQPAYVGTDGTVLQVGDHLQHQDGSITRIERVDMSVGKLYGTQVSGPEHNPARIDANPVEIEAKKINSARSGSVKPATFDQGTHERRIFNGMSRYSHLHGLSPEFIDANRGAIADKLAESYDSIPYVENGEIKVARWGRDVPDTSQILFPHDGNAVERVCQQWAKAEAVGEPAWRFKGVLESLTNRSWHGGLSSELQPKIDQYKAEIKAAQEPTHKEGDRKTENGVEYELRGGRWHKVMQDAPAPAPVGSSSVGAAVSAHPEITPSMQTRIVQRIQDDAEMFGMDAATIKDSVVSLLSAGGRLGHMKPLDDGRKNEIASAIADTLTQPAKAAPQPSDADNALIGMRKIMADKLGSTNLGEVLAMTDEQNKRIAFDKMFDNSVRSLARPNLSGLPDLDVAREAYRSLLYDDTAKAKIRDQVYAEMTGSAKPGAVNLTTGLSLLQDAVGKIMGERIDQAIRDTRKADWVGSTFKEREVKAAIAGALSVGSLSDADPDKVEAAFQIAKQHYGGSTPAETGTVVPSDHPDPIGAIHDALQRIEEADSDRGSEKNDMGWSAFTREFGSSLANQVAAGNGLTANQYKAALDMLSSKHRRQAGDLPTSEQLNAALKSMPKSGVKASLKQTVHAKKGHDLHVVALDERVDRDVYQNLNDEAKRLGGYYSRYDKQGAIPGFQFSDRDKAEQFMDYASTLQKSARFTIGGVAYRPAEVDGRLSLVRHKPFTVRLIYGGIHAIRS